MRFMLGFFAFGAVVGVTAPALATITTATFTGTVFRGYDQTGVLGAAGTILDKMPFTVVYTIDDSVPGAVITRTAQQSSVKIGTGPGAITPVTAVMTIGGNSITFQSNSGGDAYRGNDVGGIDSLGAAAFNETSTDGPVDRIHYVRMGITLPIDFLDTSDYRAPLDYDVPSGWFPSPENRTGMFYDFAYDKSSNRYLFENYAIVDIASVHITSDLPEPAAWAMFIGGFGLVGVAMRRRRVTVRFA